MKNFEPANHESITTQKDRYNECIAKLVSHDGTGRFYKLLWNEFSGPVRLLIENEFLF